jgi:NAD(P)-dependent dehydrogenase (short-subunit alcohol dehydrogenase family)
MTRLALVTGANRGIGFEVCRQLAEAGFTVLLGSRDFARGAEAAYALQAAGSRVVACQVDVTRHESISALRQRVEHDYGALDVLVNNAAILYDIWQRPSNASLAEVQQAWDTNTLGAWRMIQAFLPLLRRGTSPRIVNVSSEAGSLASMDPSAPAYNVSKVALNGLTRMFARELASDRILVNAVCPGWTATDMGGGGRPVSEGAASVTWAALLPDDGPSGGFFRDGRLLPW